MQHSREDPDGAHHHGGGGAPQQRPRVSINKSYSVTSRSSPCRVESVIVVVDAVDACGGVQRIPGSPRIDRYLDATHTLLPVLQLASESRMRMRIE